VTVDQTIHYFRHHFKSSGFFLHSNIKTFTNIFGPSFSGSFKKFFSFLVKYEWNITYQLAGELIEKAKVSLEERSLFNFTRNIFELSWILLKIVFDISGARNYGIYAASFVSSTNYIWPFIQSSSAAWLWSRYEHDARHNLSYVVLFNPESEKSSPNTAISNDNS